MIEYDIRFIALFKKYIWYYHLLRGNAVASLKNAYHYICRLCILYTATQKLWKIWVEMQRQYIWLYVTFSQLLSNEFIDSRFQLLLYQGEMIFRMK